MTPTYRYDVDVLHLLVSPAHAYFGRACDGAADVPTANADRVEVVAGKGIVGDRFFGKAAHMDAAVTLFAVEALEAMAAELDAAPRPAPDPPERDPQGPHLAPLLGQDFALESRGDVVRFKGGRPAHPCAWMDRMLAAGAMPPCAGAAGCAAGRFPTACCTAGLPCWSARYCLSRNRQAFRTCSAPGRLP